MIEVHRNRTNVHTVSLGFDVSDQTIRSQIRVGQDPSSELIAEWDVEVIGDGSSGELRLSLDNSVTKDIVHHQGYMDILREMDGEPYSILEAPIVVVFKNMPTAPTVE